MTSILASLRQDEVELNDIFESTTLGEGYGDKEHINVILYNVRSLFNKLDIVKQFINELTIKPPILIFCETWFTGDGECDFFENYQGYHFKREAQIGGGVSIYIPNQWDTTQIYELECTDLKICETIFVEIKINKICILVGGLYRPPSSDINSFFDYLDSITDKILEYKGGIILGGDFNIDLLVRDENYSSLLSIINTMGLINLVNEPTRVTIDRESCIDNILYSTNICPIFKKIEIIDISDHYPIISSFNIPNLLRNEQDYKKYTNPSNFNLTINKNKLNNLDPNNNEFNGIYGINDLDDAIKIFIQIIYDNLFSNNKYTNHHNVTQGKLVFRIPWMNSGVLKMIKEKNKLFRKAKFSQDPIMKDNYKKFRNKLNNTLKMLKKKYYAETFRNNKNNKKFIWKTINGLIGKNKNQIEKFNGGILYEGAHLTRPKEMAEAFSEIYSKVAENYHQNLPNTPSQQKIYFSSLPLYQSIPFLLESTTAEEILLTIRELRITKAPDYMGFSSELLNKIAEWISKPLSYIINLSFDQAYFPTELGLSIIFPKHKNGNKKLITNYRPISTSSVLSKIMEKVFLKKLNVFLLQNNILCKEQFGFRAGHSTDLAILAYIQDIINDIDLGYKKISIVLDIAKAFDTIDHNILYQKLDRYGIRNKPLNWIKSFISHRHQKVSIKGSLSNSKKLNYGVPQGSILGPTLFLLYINDIVRSTEILTFNLYADDTIITYKCIDMESSFSIINIELTKIFNWMKYNKLTINHTKTKLISYRHYNKKGIDLLNRIKIDDKILKQIKTFKYLGINIDEALTWTPHISELQIRLSRTLAIMYKLKGTLGYEELKTIYFSLFNQIINYGNIIWGNASYNKTKRIITIQKRAIKILNDSYLNTHTANNFIRPLTPMEIYLTQLGIFFYKIINNQLPFLLQKYDYLFTSEPMHQHYTRNVSTPRLPNCHTTIARTSVIFGIIERFTFYNQTIKREQSLNITKNILRNNILSLRIN